MVQKQDVHCERIESAVILLHGGAGPIRSSPRSEQREQELVRIARQAYQQYQTGRSAVDIVQWCVEQLEDCPLFNAGIGSVLTESGIVEMDASIIDGQSGKAGAVALIRQLRHPVAAARWVMEHTPYVLLAGPDAEQWLIQQGLETIDPQDLKTPERLRQWRKVTEQSLDHQAERNAAEGQTVGAVVIDRAANFAAATSTGGMMRKKAGRIGDSAIIGAGTFAENSNCAVSTTGEGEFFIRAAVAATIAALRRKGANVLVEAVQQGLQRMQQLGGSGGVIALDSMQGVLAFTTTGMYRAAVTRHGKIVVGSQRRLIVVP